MPIPTAPLSPSALITDLYQLTMAQGYWKRGLAEHQAVFQLTFRRCPFAGQYAIAAGLASVIDFLRDYHFESDELGYLGGLKGADKNPLFSGDFLRYLKAMRFQCHLDAAPEGAAVFPNEPLVRVEGPLIQAQLVETALLNAINFQTLIATKASRLRTAAGDDRILEFGLRRAQGFDGGLSASRAAYVGGCSATSNVLAGQRFGIPVKGTHAHSWVMAFDSELEAFRAYADAMPNNVVLLVDTFDTLQGVRHAIRVSLELREQGHQAIGIRLDSGDLVELSRRAQGDVGRSWIAGCHDCRQQRLGRIPYRTAQTRGRDDKRVGRGDSFGHGL